jgi:hypothetical protein
MKKSNPIHNYLYDVIEEQNKDNLLFFIDIVCDCDDYYLKRLNKMYNDGDNQKTHRYACKLYDKSKNYHNKMNNLIDIIQEGSGTSQYYFIKNEIDKFNNNQIQEISGNVVFMLSNKNRLLNPILVGLGQVHIKDVSSLLPKITREHPRKKEFNQNIDNANEGIKKYYKEKFGIVIRDISKKEIVVKQPTTFEESVKKADELLERASDIEDGYESIDDEIEPILQKVEQEDIPKKIEKKDIPKKIEKKDTLDKLIEEQEKIQEKERIEKKDTLDKLIKEQEKIQEQEQEQEKTKLVESKKMINDFMQKRLQYQTILEDNTIEFINNNFNKLKLYSKENEKLMQEIFSKI